MIVPFNCGVPGLVIEMVRRVIRTVRVIEVAPWSDMGAEVL